MIDKVEIRYADLPIGAKYYRHSDNPIPIVKKAKAGRGNYLVWVDDKPIYGPTEPNYVHTVPDGWRDDPHKTRNTLGAIFRWSSMYESWINTGRHILVRAGQSPEDALYEETLHKGFPYVHSPDFKVFFPSNQYRDNE